MTDEEFLESVAEMLAINGADVEHDGIRYLFDAGLALDAYRKSEGRLDGHDDPPALILYLTDGDWWVEAD